MQGQKPSTGGPAVTHHHGGLACPALPHFICQQRLSTEMCASWIHFSGLAPRKHLPFPRALIPQAPLTLMALPCHPAHGIFPCTIPKVSFPLHPSYSTLLSSDPVCTGFGSHSPSLPMARSLLPALFPPPKKSLCSYGA